MGFTAPQNHREYPLAIYVSKNLLQRCMAFLLRITIHLPHHLISAINQSMSKPIPFPIDLLDCSAVSELTCAQYGILIRLLERFWKTGEPIPKNDYTIYHAIRCPYKLWAMSKNTVFKALAVVMPAVSEARKRLVANKLRQSQVAVIARKAIKPKPKNKEAMFYDKNDTCEKFTPISAPAKSFHAGHSDHVSVKNAKENNKSDAEKLFFDR